ncbi:hypothetical protein FKM82_014926 [Ascaphus truei]
MCRIYITDCPLSQQTCMYSVPWVSGALRLHITDMEGWRPASIFVYAFKLISQKNLTVGFLRLRIFMTYLVFLGHFTIVHDKNSSGQPRGGIPCTVASMERTK